MGTGLTPFATNGDGGAVYTTHMQAPIFAKMQNDPNASCIGVLEPGTQVEALQIIANTQGKMMLQHAHGWTQMKSPDVRLTVPPIAALRLPTG